MLSYAEEKTFIQQKWNNSCTSIPRYKMCRWVFPLSICWRHHTLSEPLWLKSAFNLIPGVPLPAPRARLGCVIKKKYSVKFYSVACLHAPFPARIWSVTDHFNMQGVKLCHPSSSFRFPELFVILQFWTPNKLWTQVVLVGMWPAPR